jgi:hypothetical protein
VDGAVAGEAAEHGAGFGVGWGFGFGGVRCGFEGGGLAGAGGAFHASVHGFVGQSVGVFVFVAEGVGDFEGF